MKKTRLLERGKRLLVAAMMTAAVLSLLAVPSEECGLAEFFVMLVGSKAAAFALIFGVQWLLFGKKVNNNKHTQL